MSNCLSAFSFVRTPWGNVLLRGGPRWQSQAVQRTQRMPKVSMSTKPQEQFSNNLQTGGLSLGLMKAPAPDLLLSSIGKLVLHSPIAFTGQQ